MKPVIHQSGEQIHRPKEQTQQGEVRCHLLFQGNMGWNQLQVTSTSPVVAGLDGAYMYFVHSYMVVPSLDHTLATTDHDGVTIPAIIQEGPLLATQFHPEKSGPLGRRLLANLKECSWA